MNLPSVSAVFCSVSGGLVAVAPDTRVCGKEGGLVAVHLDQIVRGRALEFRSMSMKISRF